MVCASGQTELQVKEIEPVIANLCARLLPQFGLCGLHARASKRKLPPRRAKFEATKRARLVKWRVRGSHVSVNYGSSARP